METMSSVAVFVAVLMATAVVVEKAKATEHMVGAKLGWKKPPHDANNTYYTSWSSNHTFVVGDTLVFDYQEGEDDVAEVNKKDFDACNDTDPILYATIGPAVIEIQSTGHHYFISTAVGHCPGGQKLAIEVVAAANSNHSTPPAQAPSGSVAADGPESDLPEPPVIGGKGAPPHHHHSASFPLDATSPLIIMSIIGAIIAPFLISPFS